ncbi:DUF4352 domain-containing protein [Cellulomonas hominis]
MTTSPLPTPPQPAGAPAPNPDARRRGFFARHTVFTGFLLLVAVVVVVSVASNGGSDPAADTGPGPVADGAATSADPAADSGGDAADDPADAAADAGADGQDLAAGIGTPVRDGKFEFTVTALEPGVARIGDELLGQDAQGQFVLVHVTVTNIGDEAQYFDASSQTLLDTLGRQHSADSAAALYVDDSNSFLNQINPGNSVEGIVVFDIPADAVPAALELHDSMLSGGVTVQVG